MPEAEKWLQGQTRELLYALCYLYICFSKNSEKPVATKILRLLTKNFYDDKNSSSLICNFRLFDLICYLLFGITCSNHLNSKYLISTSFFGKYFKFFKPFINFIFIGLDTIFYFRLVWKVVKKQILYIFIAMYVYIVLDKKIIDLFGKTMLPVICAILKIWRNKNWWEIGVLQVSQ